MPTAGCGICGHINNHAPYTVSIKVARLVHPVPRRGPAGDGVCQDRHGPHDAVDAHPSRALGDPHLAGLIA
jgi:hypothetical protein